MCVGVIRGFAFIKFSGSLNVWGIVVVIKKITILMSIIVCISLVVKYWWNGICFVVLL